MKQVSGILTLLIFSICKAGSVKSGRSGGKMYFGESSRGVRPKKCVSCPSQYICYGTLGGPLSHMVKKLESLFPLVLTPVLPPQHHDYHL